MLLWFLGGSLLIIWFVLRDPRFDMRFLAIGALLPDIVDGPFGGARAMHSLIANVALLAAAVLVTIGRRPWRRRLIAVVFGSLLHLVLDGVFANTDVFLWPLTKRPADAPLPSIERGLLVVPMELAGGAALWWAWKRFGLADPARRRRLLADGELVDG